MAEKFYTILTAAGKAKIANAIPTGQKINLTKMKFGDGNGAYYNPNENQTDLKNIVYECNVTTVNIDEKNPNWITLTSVIPPEIGGFTIREIGVYDDTNTLIAIGKYPETYKPILDNGSTKELYVKMTLEVSNTNSVELKVDPYIILATKKDVNEVNEKLSSQLEQKANKSETKDIQQQVNNLVLGAVGDGNNAEVIQARGSYNLLHERLSSIEMYGYNLKNEFTNMWEIGSINVNDGTLLSSSTRIRLKNNIFLSEKTMLKCSTSCKVLLVEYTSNGTYIKSSVYSNLITIQSNGYYNIILAKTDDTEITDIYNLSLSLEILINISRIINSEKKYNNNTNLNYKNTITVEYINKENIESPISSDYTIINNNITSYKNRVQSENYWNAIITLNDNITFKKLTGMFVCGYDGNYIYAISSTKTLYKLNRKGSDFILVKENFISKNLNNIELTLINDNGVIYFIEQNGEIYEQFNISSLTNLVGNITICYGATYLTNLTNIYPTNTNIIQFYNKSFINLKKELETIKNINNGNQWLGKKWYAYGTSMTSTAQGKYAPYLAQFSGMILHNFGIPGGGICPTATHGGNVKAKVMECPSDVDLVTLECIPNDNSVKLGDIYDTGDDSFCGNLHQCIKYLQENTRATIVILITNKSRYLATDKNILQPPSYKNEVDGTTWFDRCEATRKVANLHGVQCLDASSESGLGYYRIGKDNKYVLDQIHDSDLGGYNIAKYFWSKLKNIPLWYSELPI